MEIKKVLVHSCFQRQKNPLMPQKCRCRKWIPKIQADEYIERGEAQHTWKSVKTLIKEVSCIVCPKQRESECKTCKGTRKVIYTEEIIEYSEDIILSVSFSGKRNVNKIRTPRTPTIEEEHIERAYVEGNLAAKKRIDTYGELNRQLLRSLIVGPEPPDDPEKGTGRKHDYGRSI